jgi:hypothetical protein
VLIQLSLHNSVLAPLHPPTSRLRLSKERRQKLEEADVRKFKARVRSKNNDECEDDTDEYPPTSDIDEERYFPRDYKLSSPKPWPLPKRFSNIASIGINSGYQIHTKKNQRMPSPPEEDYHHLHHLFHHLCLLLLIIPHLIVPHLIPQVVGEEVLHYSERTKQEGKQEKDHLVKEGIVKPEAAVVTQMTSRMVDVTRKKRSKGENQTYTNLGL